MAVSITQKMQLVGVEERDDDHLHVPVGELILHLQESQPHPVVIDWRLTDPALIAEVLAVWRPYSNAVKMATDPRSPSYGQLWPPAPTFELSLTLAG